MFDVRKIKFNEPAFHEEAYKKWGRDYPRDFFDRQQQKAAVQDVLLDLNVRRAIFIYGERRAGKTSMLQYLVTKFQNEYPTAVLASLPYHGVSSATKFFQELEKVLCNTLPAASSGSNSEHLSASHIQTDIIPKLQENGFRPILIYIDEFDNLLRELRKTSPNDANEVLGFFLTLIENPDLPVKTIFTTVQPLDATGFTSPLSTKALHLVMSPFEEEDAIDMMQTMLKTGVTWDDLISILDIKAICRLAGCWPYFLKALLTHLAQTEPSPQWLDQAKEKTLRDVNVSNTLMHVYQNHFDEDERAVMLWLANEGGKLTNEKLSLTVPSLLPAAQQLEKRFFLKEEEDGIVFRTDILYDWFKHWGEFKEEWKKYRYKTLPIKGTEPLRY